MIVLTSGSAERLRMGLYRIRPGTRAPETIEGVDLVSLDAAGKDLFQRCGTRGGAGNSYVRFVAADGRPLLGDALAVESGVGLESARGTVEVTPLGCVGFDRSRVGFTVRTRDDRQALHVDASNAGSETLRLDSALPLRSHSICASAFTPSTRALLISGTHALLFPPGAEGIGGGTFALSEACSLDAGGRCVDGALETLRATESTDVPFAVGRCIVAPRDGKRRAVVATRASSPHDTKVIKYQSPARGRVGDPLVAVTGSEDAPSSRAFVSASAELVGCVATQEGSVAWLRAGGQIRYRARRGGGAPMGTEQGLRLVARFQEESGALLAELTGPFRADEATPFPESETARLVGHLKVRTGTRVAPLFLVEDAFGVRTPLVAGQACGISLDPSPSTLEISPTNIGSTRRPPGSFLRISSLLPTLPGRGWTFAVRKERVAPPPLPFKGMLDGPWAGEPQVALDRDACAREPGFEPVAGDVVTFDEPGFFGLSLKACSPSGVGYLFAPRIFHVDGKEPDFVLGWGGAFEAGGQAFITRLFQPLEVLVHALNDDSVPFESLAQALECEVVLDVGTLAQIPLPTKCEFGTPRSGDRAIPLRADWRFDKSLHGKSWDIDYLAMLLGARLKVGVRVPTWGEPRGVSHWVSFPVPLALKGGFTDAGRAVPEEEVRAGAVAFGFRLDGSPLSLTRLGTVLHFPTPSENARVVATHPGFGVEQFTVEERPEGDFVATPDGERGHGYGQLEPGALFEIRDGVFGAIDAMYATSFMREGERIAEGSWDSSGVIVSKASPSVDFPRLVCSEGTCGEIGAGAFGSIFDLQGNFGTWYALEEDTVTVGSAWTTRRARYQRPSTLHPTRRRRSRVMVDPWDRIWDGEEGTIIDLASGRTVKAAEAYPAMDPAFGAVGVRAVLPRDDASEPFMALLAGGRACIVRRAGARCIEPFEEGEFFGQAFAKEGWLHLEVLASGADDVRHLRGLLFINAADLTLKQAHERTTLIA